MKNKKKKIIILLLLTPLFVMFMSNYSIEKYAANKTYSDSSKIKKNKVGLVLGTAKMLSNGRVNLYFKYRIEATVQLYKEGKIDFVLISGDNGNKNYDEPTDFKNELITKGIPGSKIFWIMQGLEHLTLLSERKKFLDKIA